MNVLRPYVLCWARKEYSTPFARPFCTRLRCCHGCKISFVPFPRGVCVCNITLDAFVGCSTPPPDQDVDAGPDAVFYCVLMHVMLVSLRALHAERARGCRPLCVRAHQSFLSLCR